MNDHPIEARCDHCKQTRRLIQYTPDHDHAVTDDLAACEWCRRDMQPLLCPSCWSKEAEREDKTLRGPEELADAEAMHWRVAKEARLIRQDEANGGQR